MQTCLTSLLIRERQNHSEIPLPTRQDGENAEGGRENTEHCLAHGQGHAATGTLMHGVGGDREWAGHVIRDSHFKKHCQPRRSGLPAGL